MGKYKGVKELEGGKVGKWESMKVKSWGGGGRVRNGVGEEV